MALPVDARETNALRGKGKLQRVLHKRENRLSLHKTTQLMTKALMTKARLLLVVGVAGTTQAITHVRSQREMHNRGQMVDITIRGPVRAVS